MLDFLRRLFQRGSTEPLTGLDPLRTRVIVGLGNPGPEYSDTRHNVGFRCVDVIANRYGAAWQPRESLNTRVAVIHPDVEHTIVLAKPQTYMNRSGKAAHDLLELDRKSVV